MRPERQQTLRISVNAKSKPFDFKFKATTILPTTSKFIPFPIKLNLKLKLCPSLFQSKKPEHFPKPRLGKSWKSKFLRILAKFRPGPSENKANASNQTSNLGNPGAHFPYNQLRHFPNYEEPMFISSIVIGLIALLLSQSISQNNQNVMVLYTLIILLHLALILKKFIPRRTMNSLVTAIFSMLCSAILVSLSNMLKIDNVRKFCMELCSSFAQMVHSSVSQYAGAHRGDNHLGYLTF